MSGELILSATAPSTSTIRGDLRVNRMGYRAMQITEPGNCDPPADRKDALATLVRTVKFCTCLVVN
jgi:hypothetical protein